MKLFCIILGMLIACAAYCDEPEMEEWIQNLKNSVQNDSFMANLGQNEDFLNLMQDHEQNDLVFGETSIQNLVKKAEELQSGKVDDYLSQYAPDLPSQTENSKASRDVKKLIQENFLNGDKYVINPNEPLLLDAKNIQIQSDVDRITTTTSSFEEHQCEESIHQFTEKVRESLVIDFEEALEKKQSVSLFASAKNEYSVNITANLVTGEIKSQGNGDNLLHSDSKVVNPLGQIPLGAIAKFQRTRPYSFWNGLTESVETFIGSEPSKENGYQFTFGLAQKNCNKKHRALCNQFRGMQHHWEATIYLPPVYKAEHWKGAEKIQSLIDKGWCQQISGRCIVGDSSRTFGQGESALNVHRDCWEKETTYQCGVGSSPKEGCSDLKSKGCEQINSVCKQFYNNVCAIYEQQYRCPVSSETTTENIQFDLEALSQDGRPLKFEENKDFGEAFSALSLTDAFVKEQVGQKGMAGNFFGGQSSACEVLPKQCCAQRGMVKKLLGCSEKEEELASKVQNGLCYLIEETKKGMFHQKKRHYCCFHSKLGRIVQVGAREQLGFDFGSAETPNCRALNVEEIQKVDWSRVDFSEIIQDFKQKASLNKLNAHLQNMATQKTISNQKNEEEELIGAFNEKINALKNSSSAPLNEYYRENNFGDPHD